MSTWQQQTTKREHWSLSIPSNLCEVKEPHKYLKIRCVHWKLWEYGPHRFLHFPVGVSPLVQKTVHRKMRIQKFKSSKIVWELLFCRSQPSGPVWFLESVGEILCQKFKFVAEIWISWQKYILNLCEKNNIKININITILWEYWNLSVVKLSFFRPTVFKITKPNCTKCSKKMLNDLIHFFTSYFK